MRPWRGLLGGTKCYFTFYITKNAWRNCVSMPIVFHNCAVLSEQRNKNRPLGGWTCRGNDGMKTLRFDLSAALKTSSQTTPQSTQFFPPSRNSSPNTRFSRVFVTAYHSGVYNLNASFNAPHPTFHAAKSHLSHLDTWSFAPRSLTFRASKA